MKNSITIILCALMFAGCNNYGSKIDMSGDDVYYKEPVTEEVATNVGQFLVDYKYFSGQGYSIQVVNENGYRVRFVTKEGVENDPEIIGGFKFLLIDLCNAAFAGETADIDLCDDKLETKITISYQEAQTYMNELLNAQ